MIAEFLLPYSASQPPVWKLISADDHGTGKVGLRTSGNSAGHGNAIHVGICTPRAARGCALKAWPIRGMAPKPDRLDHLRRGRGRRRVRFILFGRRSGFHWKRTSSATGQQEDLQWSRGLPGGETSFAIDRYRPGRLTATVAPNGLKPMKYRLQHVWAIYGRPGAGYRPNASVSVFWMILPSRVTLTCADASGLFPALSVTMP